MMKGDLLTLIARATQKKYLSDLHQVSPQELSDALKQFPVSNFSNVQWGYALSYIFNRTIVLEPDADVRAFVKSMKPRQ